MRIDAHQHFWKLDRGDYHWMSPALTVLYRDYLPADLQGHLAKRWIDRTIVVQAAPTVAETDFLLKLADQNSFIAGVVGWLDLEAADFDQQFNRYRANPKFIGLRPMIQDIPDDEWILRPQVLRSLKTIADADFPIDLLTHPRHLPHLLRALDKVGPLRGVIDHISKPAIKEHTLEPWKQQITEVATHPTIYCKLSGMITEADHQNWKPGDLRPYIEHVIDCFGWDRVIFGSDWPVCLLAGSYDEVIDTLTEILNPRMSAAEEERLFGVNAARFYQLGKVSS